MTNDVNDSVVATIGNINRLEAAGQLIFASTRSRLEQLTERLRVATDLNQQGLLPGGSDTLLRVFRQVADEAERQQTQVNEAFADSFSGILENAQRELGSLSQFGIQAGRNLQSALGDRLAEGLKGNFDGIGRSFRDLLADMVAQVAANRLLTGIFGGFQNNPGFLGNLSAGLLNIDKRALGGPFSGARPVLVGERGPELLFPNGRPGFVAPNSALGSPVQEVHIHNAPQGTQVAHRRVDHNRMITDVVIGTVMDELQRNGPFSQIIQGQYGLRRSFQT